MDISEKILALRKSRNLTQEQLADSLNVSRQSVSKWESGQAVPELEKIVALSGLFDVTTDYLLHPSEIDELSVKADLLEKQQQQMLMREEKRSRCVRCMMYSLGIYLLYFAVFFIEKYYLKVWNPSVILAEFLITTAIVIFVCLKCTRKKE